MNRRPDLGRGDGIAGDNFRLVLQPVDRADRRRVIGSVSGEGETKDDEKG
jgi:hypothetical protein